MATGIFDTAPIRMTLEVCARKYTHIRLTMLVCVRVSVCVQICVCASNHDDWIVDGQRVYQWLVRHSISNLVQTYQCKIKRFFISVEVFCRMVFAKMLWFRGNWFNVNNKREIDFSVHRDHLINKLWGVWNGWRRWLVDCLFIIWR